MLCLEDRGAGRGLYVNQRVLGGTALLSVPWSAGLTARSAMLRLRQLEAANQGARTAVAYWLLLQQMETASCADQGHM